MKKISIFLSFSLLNFVKSSGQDLLSPRPDGHAPIGVMGDHTHKAGEWMLSYRYMFMEMEGNRSGTNQLTHQEVLNQGFMVTPTSMSMEMHMLGAMYAPSDQLTLMAMVPFTSFTMDHLTRMGGMFTTETEGLGDIRLSSLLKIYEDDSQSIHLNAGLSIPTGSITERGNTPAGANSKLPYPMQLGSGTFDLLPGITYLTQSDNWSWGAQLSGTIRLGQNDEGYTLGDRLNGTLWAARQWNHWLSTSIRIKASKWDNIDGADTDLNPNMIPTANTALRGGERIDALLGLNIVIPSGPLAGHRLAVEAGAPIYQSLNGPQLETDWLMTIGWQLAW